MTMKIEYISQTTEGYLYEFYRNVKHKIDKINEHRSMIL